MDFVLGLNGPSLDDELKFSGAARRAGRNQGEIEAAREGTLPDLVGYGDLKGDLQIQTTWTDGANSIEEMAHEAKGRGLRYIAVTDHTKGLAMTGGADEKKLLKQIDAIDKINRSKSNQDLLGSMAK